MEDYLNFFFLFFTRILAIFLVTFINPFSLLTCPHLKELPSSLQLINLGVLPHGDDFVLGDVFQMHLDDNIVKPFNIFK